MNTLVNPVDRVHDALLVIDVQNDFCANGALAVPGGDEIIPGLLALSSRFDTIVLTQDFHPQGHGSFASTHGLPPFSTIDMAYGEQVLWPDHCVQGSQGADFRSALVNNANGCGLLAKACAIIRKGMNQHVDSYSAFFENDHCSATGLAGFLKGRGISRVFCTGLAYDFCVGFSALDAVAAGLKAVVVKDLTRAISMPMPGGIDATSVDAIERKFAMSGVEVVSAADLAPRMPAPRRG